MKDCPFCLGTTPLKGTIKHQTDRWYFLDMFAEEGANAGLAIPRRHVETPFELNADEWAELHSLLPAYKSLIDEREVPQGYNIGWNVGAAGGQTVFHAHLHIVGRYDDEEQAGRGIRYHFKPPVNPRKT